MSEYSSKIIPFKEISYLSMIPDRTKFNPEKDVVLERLGDFHFGFILYTF